MQTNEYQFSSITLPRLMSGVLCRISIYRVFHSKLPVDISRKF